MKRTTALISIVAALIMILALMPATAFAAEGSTGGSFTNGNAAPTIGTITISPTSLTPQQEWTVITVPVTDTNQLADVKEVKVTLFYDATAAHGAPPGSADVQTCAILTWTRGTPDTWTIAPGSTTWGINETGCSKAADSGTTGDWVFSFKVGKVATESPGTPVWDIYALATDTANATGNNRKDDVEMLWYGEITVNTGSVDWGAVSMGLTFEGGANPETGISVKYLCNGDYYEDVKSADWGTVALDETGGNPPSTAGKLSLKACRTNDLVSAIVVTTTYGTPAHLSSAGTITAETGSTVVTNTLWLALSSSGIASGAHNGTIYYQVANR